MRHSPFLIAGELKETLCTYLETSYRISNQIVVDERAALLRYEGVISKPPFVETTPRFAPGAWLHDLAHPAIPNQLTEFASIGLPVGKYPLYKHQEDSLRAAWVKDDTKPQDVVVASGTGSGKTEVFYLTIFADILREAIKWSAPKRKPTDMGMWKGNQWLHRRRYENRPAAMRAIILYPMNALVNDQLRRLRKMLSSDAAMAWQYKHLNGNLIYFGRYTSQAMLPGSPDNGNKRSDWEQYLSRIKTEWENMGEELRLSGNQPRPDSSEMVGRWNMQAAPPDILLTNYSMLEYMLVRPIEARIFESTRHWLEQSKEHVLTLVLDEAHTYSGARGTEVAYLIRRLYERLGVSEDQIRCIATSASLGETPEELNRVSHFVSGLFDHPVERFSLVRASIVTPKDDLPAPTLTELYAFSQFQVALEGDTSEADEAVAVDQLIADLGKETKGLNHIERLYHALEAHPRIIAVRKITARRATELGQVAQEIWGDLGDAKSCQKATAGLLTAGALARSDGKLLSDIPPLLPSRMHLMYRGLPGLWGCIDPNCSAAENPTTDRPCGKLYAEPRIWCECGARVVELLSCHVCGLRVGGGIAESDSDAGRVWPYQDDLESGGSQYDRYALFALEDPNPDRGSHKEWMRTIRNVKTTAYDTEGNKDTRPVWEPERKNDDVHDISAPCPRCVHSSRGGRNAIEPLRTTGAKAFGALIEHAFRLEPSRVSDDIQAELKLDESEEEDSWWTPAVTTGSLKPPTVNPNIGRKALTFSDSRQNAARLAGDLTFGHYRDVFRQLLLSVLSRAKNQPIPVHELIEEVLALAVERGIDPTFGELENFWARLETNSGEARSEAVKYLDVWLRREIADRQVGVESLGLARWVVDGLDPEKIPTLKPFTREETVALVYAVLRILVGENTLLPRSRDPEDWPSGELVEPFYRRVIAPKEKNQFRWDAEARNRLTRYLQAVLAAKVGIQLKLDDLLAQLWKTYFVGKIALSVQGKRQGFGIPITGLALAAMPHQVYVCRSCQYLSAETVGGVCVRCHQQCELVSLDQAHNRQRNYYRLLSDFAVSSEYPDPFPFHALEHTAQISAEEAAKRERRFQDQFLPEKENPVQDSVDVLSVTTTMEMGIDIGDLTVVGLHNMPPTVANYQQRAGRAGRRSDGVAEVITFSRLRSHDQYYYERVTEIVAGKVRIPSLHLNNAVIARRHVNALILQKFFVHLHFGGASTQLFESFGTVDDLLANGEQRLNQLREFTQYLRVNDTKMSSVMRIMDSSGVDETEVMSWITELPDRVKEVVAGLGVSSQLLDVLIEKGILPRYAFPVDVVALWLDKPTQWNRGEEIQRDLTIALSEYAPGADVIVNGKIHTSVGLYTPFVQSPDYRPSGWYYECNKCHHVQFASTDASATRPSWTECSMCGEKVGRNSHYTIMPAIVPKGFRTIWSWKDSKRYRGEGQDRAGFASSAQLVAGDSAELGATQFDQRMFVYNRTGDLFVVNRGPSDGDKTPGFEICPKCGADMKFQEVEHKLPGTGIECSGGKQATLSVLLHNFNSDIVLMGVRLPNGYSAYPGEPGGRAVWLSFATALRLAAAAHLQIDPEELAMGIRPWREPDTGRLSAEVFLYDTLPNGAGYAAEVTADIEAVLCRVLELTANCPTACETACYRCMLDYGNQRHHGLLDRYLAHDVISYVLDGSIPELTSEIGRKSLLHLAPYAGEVVVGGSSPIYGRVIDPAYNRPVAVIPVHTLQTRSLQKFNSTDVDGAHPVVVSHFDLVRRPFWVWDKIVPIMQGRSDAKSID